jgi:hypothetical protein
MDGFYVWCYMGMILLWPFPAEAPRMVLVLFPILLWQSIWMLGRWQLGEKPVQPLRLVLLGVLLIAVLPDAFLNGQRFYGPLPENVPQAYKHTEDWYNPDPAAAMFGVQVASALDADISQLGQIVPENACIFAIKPSIIAYLSGRICKAPPSVKVDDTQFDRELIKQGCRYFYLLGFASPSYQVAMYPYQRMQSKLEVIKPTLIQSTDGKVGVVGLFARLK